ARGVRFGRKLKLTAHQRQEALQRRAPGDADRECPGFRRLTQHDQSACGGVARTREIILEVGAALSVGLSTAPIFLLFVASCYVRIRSTSCPEIGALLFSALDVGGFSAAGNWRTVARWRSCRNVSRRISPSGNSRAW